MFPSNRLIQAGATPDEVAQLQAEHEASSPAAQESKLARFERIAEQDIREWLNGLRAASHFGVKPAETDTVGTEGQAGEKSTPDTDSAPHDADPDDDGPTDGTPEPTQTVRKGSAKAKNTD